MENEHPDDLEARIEIELNAVEHANSFVKEYERLVVSLFSTYSDADAIRKLDKLREHFYYQWLTEHAGVIK